MAENMSDKELLIKAMEQMAAGHFEEVDASVFEDVEIAQAFNHMASSVARRNNHYMMRINDSMRMIGDGGWLKTLFEVIAIQQDTLKEVQQLDDLYNTALGEMGQDGVSALTLIRQLEANLTPCIHNINEILESLSAGAAAGEIQPALEAKMRRLLTFNSRELISMLYQISGASRAIQSIYDKNDSQIKTAGPLIDDVKKLTETCNQLSLDCFNAGHHIYGISRSVDNARNDMFRKNSLPTIHDSLKIYAVDHIVVTWRLYNHIQEYESLKITQLNNPDRCKFGLWLNNTSPEWVRETEAYRHAFDAHEELHRHAVACFEAKERADIAGAMEEFEHALSSLSDLLITFEELHVEFHMRGIQEETSTDEGSV